MDEVTSLLEELAQLGVKVTPDGGRLKVSSSKGVLTSDLQRRVADGKEEILRRLRSVPPAEPGPAAMLSLDPGSDHLPFPMSDLQLGFYVANDPHMEYHVRPHFYMEFDHGAFDVAACEGAWNKALKRHRRELCVVNRDADLQMLEGTPAIECRVYDLCGRTADEVAAHLTAVRAEMMRQELPLDRWPWVDVRVSRWREQGRDRARVHYNHNNFFSDGFGTNQLFAEIESYYRDPDLELPPLDLSYRDAVLGLERLAASAAGEAAKRYWLDRLPGLPPPPAIPQKAGIDRRRRSHLESRLGELEAAQLQAIKSRASSFGLTPSNAIVTAYACTLANWSNSNDFILSQMVTRRFRELHPDITRILGNFASLYPLEVRLSPAASFVENARRLQDRVLEDVRHLQFGGMRVLQELNRLRGSFGTAPSPFVVGSGLFIDAYRKADFSVLETSQTILDHQFFELADGRCHYVWDVIEELFPAGVMDAMWEAYRALLLRLAGEPETWHRPLLDLVPETDLTERRARNRTGAPLPEVRLHDALAGRAATDGERPVLVSAAGTLSYRELAAWSDHLASELRARGVGRGDLVPVVMDRDPEVLVAVMAVLKAGAAYVPIDPRLPRGRLALLLNDLGASTALSQRRYVDTVGWPGSVTPVSVSRPQAAGATPPGIGEPAVAGDASDLAYVIYTSGSTGAPKGVMIDHRGAVNTILDVNQRFGVGPSDRVFGVSAFNFDLSVFDLFGTVAAGACLWYPEPDSALDSTHWLDLVARERITIWSSVPALMSLLVEAARRREVTLPDLRLVLLSGDKIPLDLPDAIHRVAPNARVSSLGGATEASIWSIVYPVDRVEPGWTTIPYGYPMANQTWHVLDRNGRPCPTWVPGELYIGGVGLAQGYWNDPGKTARAFTVDPSTGGRLYRTGDLGRYLPGGCIEWMGRVDFQVKVQGMRIEPGEIETVLAEHPAVERAVVAVKAPPEGGQPRLVAWVVAVGESAAGARDLEEFLTERLPSHMVPRVWRTVGRLPLTPNGKVDRKRLLEELDEPGAGERPRPPFVAPGDGVEARLQALWKEVLGRPRIGVLDDFFDLGGQSFDAMRIFARIQEDLGTPLTLSDMWAARTIRALAERITGGITGRTTGCVVPIDVAGHGVPLFLAHPAGGSVMAYSRLGRALDRPLYGIQAPASREHAPRRRDVRELARQYVAELRGVRPAGPYALGGWSSGAMIAFEMAAQLEAAGEEVEPVFLLDGPAPFDHGELGDDKLLRWFLEDLALGLPVERLNGSRLAGRPLEEQLRGAVALLGAGEVPPLDVTQLLPSFEVFHDLIAAGSRYRPPTVSADLTVVRVEEDVVDEFADHPHRDRDDWGWSRFTRGNVRCVRVPGTHHSFLGEPLVTTWCSILAGET